MGRYAYKTFGTVVLASLIVACSKDSGTLGNSSGTSGHMTDRIVCDPFGSTGAGTANNGLVANLYYLDDSQPRYQYVGDLIANGHPIDVNLYFNSVNVPTRPFDLGFTTQSGSLIVNQDGNTLYEYFAVHMESFLQLGPGQAPGLYDFALLADDGAIISYNPDGEGYRTMINDDGTHPTKMMCTSQPVQINEGQKIPIKLDYHQGPRYHIALVLAWRPHVDGQDPLCGQSGNSTFWDSTQNPSAPTGWTTLQSRGWKALQPVNFALPTNMGSSNPCAPSGGVPAGGFSG